MEVDDLIPFCHGLVTVEKESGIVRIIHYTSQKYLERGLPDFFPDAKICLVTTCFTYLMFDAFEDPVPSPNNEKKEEQNILLDRVANNWGYLAYDVQEEVQDLTLSAPLYLTPEGSISYALSCQVGLVKIMRALLNRGENPNGLDENVNDALCTAISFNQTAAVELLLEESYANINASDRKRAFLPPLHRAILERNDSMLDLLLRHPKIDVNLKMKNGVTRRQIAVWKKNEHAIELLSKQ
ncbi:hypothetical protein AJ79_06012 [Helicocarpus griseus UAMH5409]|uniref:Uncharacterized protein n=1 Tax=Helicocarpus griseus UAMH5409 TaxID=1447875 RepID=A0A2B7XHC8_9EURO|nr:hypothetical protein AJ79_06012 [Helicocarpus griseus UAMH5409]